MQNLIRSNKVHWWFTGDDMVYINLYICKHRHHTKKEI